MPSEATGWQASLNISRQIMDDKLKVAALPQLPVTSFPPLMDVRSFFRQFELIDDKEEKFALLICTLGEPVIYNDLKSSEIDMFAVRCRACACGILNPKWLDAEGWCAVSEAPALDADLFRHWLTDMLLQRLLALAMATAPPLPVETPSSFSGQQQ